MIQRLVGMVLFLGLSSALMYGAPQMGNDKAAADQTITGCLQKGTESGGFFLVSDNKHWELYPASGVNLSEHVGHTVTVTGIVAHRTEAQEKKSQASEKKEMGKMAHADLNVSSLKHVSETCK